MQALKPVTIDIDIHKILPGALRALASDIELNGHAQPLARPKERPLIGENWPSQGGRLVGILRDGDGERAVIVCSDKDGDFEGEWGNYGTEIADCKNDHDGRANTKAMAAASSLLANKVWGVEINGFKDWHIPARQELALCYMSAKDLFEQEWYWSSTQYSSGFAWGQYFGSGNVNYCTKGTKYRVRAVRTIPL